MLILEDWLLDFLLFSLGRKYKTKTLLATCVTLGQLEMGQYAKGKSEPSPAPHLHTDRAGQLRWQVVAPQSRPESMQGLLPWGLDGDLELYLIQECATSYGVHHGKAAPVLLQV